MESRDRDARSSETMKRAADPDARTDGASPPDRARMDRLMKRLTVGLALLFVCMFVFVESVRFAARHRLAHEAAAAASGAVVVDVVTVRPAATGPSLNLPGETHAWYESTIFARVTGYVATWNADIGDHVSKGQVLTEIDTPELDAQLVAAQAKLKASEADAQARETEAEFARTTYARWRDAPKGVVSEQEREDKKADFGSAVARVAAARAHIALDQADVDRYTALEKFKLVTAPYDGTIIERRIDIGNLVTAGSTSGTMPLYRMAKDDPMRVWVDVPQTASLDLMKTGVSVVVVANEAPKRRFEGKIVRTTRAIDPQARTFKVEIDVPNADGALVPGMYIQALFALPSVGMVQVPASALLFRSAGPQVAVVGADGRVHLRGVEISRDDGATVMLSSGVSSGERVVLNLSSEVTEGQKVVVSEGGP